MKLCLSAPVVVAVGPDSRSAGWGAYQFPNIEKLDDGRLLYTFADSADSETAYGSEPACFVSADGGLSWTKSRLREFSGLCGTTLENGDKVRFFTRASIPLEGLSLPTPIGKTWLGHTIYHMEEVDPAICDNTWHMLRTKAGNSREQEERVVLHWPHMMVRSCHGVLVPPSVRGRLRLAPDGTLWMPHYYLAGLNPKNGGFIPYLCNYLFHSKDFGHTWDLVHFLPYVPDTNEDPLAFSYEGFGENDLTFAPDGSMIRLIRTDGCYPRKGPCCYTRSNDGGKTWTKPVKFDDHGVYPCLLTLKCGVTLASYGRPGLSLRATTDASCQNWDAPIEIVYSNGEKEKEKNSVLATATCSYSNMIALDDHTAALVYSDFTVCDNQGIPHKTMLYRTITVER